MKQNIVVTIILALVFQHTSSFAAEEQTCLQKPKRSTPCPHLLYKAISYKDESNKLVCICLSDFKAFLTPAKNAQEAAIQKLERQDLTISLGMSEQEIIDLLDR